MMLSWIGVAATPVRIVCFRPEPPGYTPWALGLSSGASRGSTIIALLPSSFFLGFRLPATTGLQDPSRCSASPALTFCGAGLAVRTANSQLLLAACFSVRSLSREGADGRISSRGSVPLQNRLAIAPHRNGGAFLTSSACRDPAHRTLLLDRRGHCFFPPPLRDPEAPQKRAVLSSRHSASVTGPHGRPRNPPGDGLLPACPWRACSISALEGLR
jgi:hypothetical protein